MIVVMDLDKQHPRKQPRQRRPGVRFEQTHMYSPQRIVNQMPWSMTSTANQKKLQEYVNLHTAAGKPGDQEIQY
jgi:hypothetical protein